MSSRMLALVILLLANTALAVEMKWDEGDLLAFPMAFNESGQSVGRGQFLQKKNGSKLEVTITYDLKDGRRAEEKATFRTQPELIQEKWSFEEKKGATVTRRYEVDLKTGNARAEKLKDGKTKRKSGKVKVEEGRTFAGLGVAFAAKNLMGQLREGEVVKLSVVAFTPKPRSVKVELKKVGSDVLSAGTTTVAAERVRVHAIIPKVARPFIKVRDPELWFAKGGPPQFLRSLSPLAEPREEFLQINFFGSSTRIGRRPAATNR